jgi:DNA topoisomerase-1
VAWDRPVPQPCPVCNAKFVVKKENKRGTILRCLECDWKQGADETEENAA